MKVAVCVSGRCISKRPDGSLAACNAVLKRSFPTADFYYATWEQFRGNFTDEFPKDDCQYFTEPKITYHPYRDIHARNYISEHYIDTVNWATQPADGTWRAIETTKKRTEYTSHHLKQILIHSWLSNEIKEHYDVIVRTRFDQFVHKDADFSPYLEDTVENQRANCFGTTRMSEFDKLFEVDKSKHPLHKTWLLDHIIIHPANAIDVNQVNQLFEDKKLHAAEFGWYQIISNPHGSRHRNHSGWVNPDWTIPDDFYHASLEEDK